MTAPSKQPTAWRRDRNRSAIRRVSTLRDDVLDGLRAQPRMLPPKWLYDVEGARLFEEITALPEYYPTRTELGIIASHADEIAAMVGPDAALVEYGSGAGRKIRLLLDALECPAAYVPIDISGEQLQEVTDALRTDYPDVDIHPVRADYTQPLDLPRLSGESRRVAFFPGSTIGNFDPVDARRFLLEVRRTVGDDGAMILGLDRAKNPETLVAAYDDTRGVTAAFNLNLLVRINRQLDADFDLSQFTHLARWNATASRIEMHLRSESDQTVTVAGVPISFRQGETIWTESSYKYDRPMLDHLLAETGFSLRQLWTDDADRFWVALLA